MTKAKERASLFFHRYRGFSSIRIKQLGWLAMKRRIITMTALFVLTMIFIFEQRVTAHADRFIAVSVNDRLLTFPHVAPFIEDGMLYVPLRTFAESMDINVHWMKQSKEVQLTKDGKELLLQPAKNQMVKDNGEKVAYSIKHIDERMVVPYRSIADYFGFSVQYDSTQRLARMVDSDAELTHGQFVEKYQEELVGLREQFLQSQQVKKYAYVTFDDGPNQYTSQILAILNKHESKATFFMMDGNMKRNENDVSAMVKDGHSVGCHGVTHKKEKFYQSPAAAYKEMNQCLSTLQTISGSESVLIRVPYGSKPYMTEAYRAKVDEHGYKMWDWNIDSLDWKFQNGSKMVEHVKKQLRQLEKKEIAPILLFHEQKHTVSELETIILYLKNNGYELLPLTEEMTPYDFWDKQMESIRIK